MNIMLVLTHLFISLILTLGLFPIYKWYVLIIPLVSILIDLDHIPHYFIKFRSLNLIKAYNYFKNKTECKDLAPLHTIEVLIILLILLFYSKIILMFFLAALLHILLDIFEAVIKKKKRSFSIIHWLITKKQE